MKPRTGLSTTLTQTTTLSPIQIMTIKLLELPTLELEQRIQKELEENPVLDENIQNNNTEEGTPKKVSLSEYSASDPTPSYKLYVNNHSKDAKPQYNTFSVKESFQDSLIDQLGYRDLDKKTKFIAVFLIGSLDGDGYLRRDLQAVSNDLAFRFQIEASVEEIEDVLKIIQDFEPAGIGARDLRECLLLQLNNKSDSESKTLAKAILTDYFDAFTKKHYDKIMSKMGITQEELKDAIDQIIKLNPKPGGQLDDSYIEQASQITPDFTLEEIDGNFIVSTPKFNMPELKINKQYAQMLDANPTSKAEKEAASFVKQKIDSAKNLISALKQRQNTMLSTMNAIVDFQKDYFRDGDETKLKPMVLKNIAEKTGLDISTISRVVNSKYVDTSFGIIALKSLFSEGLMTEDGKEVSTKEIKKILQESIEEESKSKPLTDEELVIVLSNKGYKVARRTVAKYREQLNIPIARLRKEL
ncbi:MAG: RNA polymerase factor sigma-54 [Bacteroidales bacterium]|jgi:RNA polymerase sigma-54 factor|nr:RNA polymerase factor sigma-54 [Bacteroidales bacterium]MBQ5783740.1 RNA polymerase factor sigma-54 [Bacteroidales bacterium]